MNKKHYQAILLRLSFLAALLFCLNSSGFVVAQERQNQVPLNRTDICKECCGACCEEFYSNCSLSPVMVDGFNILDHETEMALLDKFAQSFNGSPHLSAYVVVYGGHINKFGELEERTNRIKKYLLNFRKLDPGQIKFVMGGFREKFTFEMWLSPVKNSYPPLTPTISPERVKFKGKMESLSSL